MQVRRQQLHHVEVDAEALNQRRPALSVSFNQRLGEVPTTRRNSRLKFDFVLKPDASIALVTDSPFSMAACAAAIRAVLMYRDTFSPVARFIVVESSFIGMPSFRDRRVKVRSGSRKGLCVSMNV